MSANALSLPDGDELWTEKRVSEFTTLSISTLQRMRAEPSLGGPPWFKLGNGRTSRVVYAKSTTVAWVASRLRTSTCAKR